MDPNRTALSTTTSIEGFEDITPEDLLIPRLRVVQKISSLPGNPPVGSLFNTVTNSSQEKVACVCMAIKHTRVWWKTKSDATPACASNDGKEPRPDMSNPPAPKCIQCPMSKWSMRDGVRTPPQCSARITMLFVERDTLAPFLVDFSRTSYQTGQAIVTTFMSLRKGLFEIPFELFARETSSKTYTYHVWAFRQGKWGEKPAEEIALYRAQFQFYRGRLDSVVAETESVRDEEAGGARQRGPEIKNAEGDDLFGPKSDDVPPPDGDELPW